MPNLIDTSHTCNTNDEVELLIVHCPREVRLMRWDPHTASIHQFLRSLGWIERRSKTAINLITPVHPALAVN